jgi:hypothetical protein
MSARSNGNADRKRILLVEPDHEIFVRLMILIDETAGEHYTLDWAASYRFGTSLLQRNHYDICLVAAQLGFQSGRDFVASAKDLKPDVPIIMLEDRPGAVVETEPGDEHLWDRLRLDQLSGQVLFSTLREAATSSPAPC